MKTEKQLELAEQLRDLDSEIRSAKIAILKSDPQSWSSFSPTEIAAHRGAYGQAKSDFLRDMEREPVSAADFSAILRRAEAIRKVAL